MTDVSLRDTIEHTGNPPAQGLVWKMIQGELNCESCTHITGGKYEEPCALYKEAMKQYDPIFKPFCPCRVSKI